MLYKSGNYVLIMLLTCTVLQSCSAPVDLEREKQNLINTDKEFSNLSKEKGVNEAFLSYLAEEGVMLRPNSYPIEGINAIRERLLKNPDQDFTLTWEPQFADVSKSGNLGYTYGIYENHIKDEKGNPVTLRGTYLSIWKKDAKGDWKLVLDTGNQGLGEK